jgi:hypothetical protein
VICLFTPPPCGASIPHACARAHSIFSVNHPDHFNITVPTSAYPLAFPEALASWGILPPCGIRLTPTQRCFTIRIAQAKGSSPNGEYATMRATRGYSVPGPRLSWHLGSRSSPGYFCDATWIKNKVVQPFSVPILDQANNPSRLVTTDDDSNTSSSSYPYATDLDGIPCWVQSYRLSLPAFTD